MSWLAQAAAKAEARLTEALNKVDSAAAPALEKAKDRLEETKAQIAEKASELGLGAGGDPQQPRRQVPRPRGEGSGAGGANAIEVAPSVPAESKASSDAPTGTVGDDAGRVDAVPEIVPQIVQPPTAPTPASAEPTKKKTQLELLRERRLAREAAAANAKGIVAGLVPDPPTEGTRTDPPSGSREPSPTHPPRCRRPRHTRRTPPKIPRKIPPGTRNDRNRTSRVTTDDEPTRERGNTRVCRREREGGCGCGARATGQASRAARARQGASNATRRGDARRGGPRRSRDRRARAARRVLGARAGGVSGEGGEGGGGVGG